MCRVQLGAPASPACRWLTTSTRRVLRRYAYARVRLHICGHIDMRTRGGSSEVEGDVHGTSWRKWLETVGHTFEDDACCIA